MAQKIINCSIIEIHSHDRLMIRSIQNANVNFMKIKKRLDVTQSVEELRLIDTKIPKFVKIFLPKLYL